MRRAAVVVFSAALGSGGCSEEPRRAVPPASAVEVNESVVDPRDQYALARELAQARAMPTPERARTLARARDAWIGRRYRWEVAYEPALCRSSRACVVLPFDHRRHSERRIDAPWLPRLELDESGHRSVTRRCEVFARCILTVEAILQTLQLAPGEPTKVGLADVAVSSVRGAVRGESWARHGREPR